MLHGSDSTMPVHYWCFKFLQWFVTIGRFDIHSSIMTMSGFRMTPRNGHLNRLVRLINGYLLKMKNASIRVRKQEPDYFNLPDNVYDWTYNVYGNVEELLPMDALNHMAIM
jgi:hypothetical protein